MRTPPKIFAFVAATVLVATGCESELASLTERAQAGDGPAQMKLAEMYQFGKGAPRNLNQAARWWRMAADQNFREAQFWLGVMYAEGDGVTKDDTEAYKWFKMAAERGQVRAQSFLGEMHSEGDGAPLDLVEAYTWFLLAGANGNLIAKHEIPKLEAKLTPTQRTEGQRRAREFRQVQSRDRD